MLGNEFGCVDQLVTDQHGAIVSLRADGSATRTYDDKVVNFRYRLITPHLGGRRVYIAYIPAAKPRHIVRNLRWFYLGPTAIQLSDSGRKDIHCSYEALKSVPDGSIPIGCGAERVAWLTQDNNVAVTGPDKVRPDCRFVLQPWKRQPLGTYSLDWFEYAETRQITNEDVTTMVSWCLSCGWEFFDKGRANLGRLTDGRLVLLDPGAIRPLNDSEAKIN